MEKAVQPLRLEYSKKRINNFNLCFQNKVQFVVSSGMTRYDIKNYLEKIYKIPVVDVRTVNKMGKTRQNAFGNYLVNDKDYKVAFVTLPEGK